MEQDTRLPKLPQVKPERWLRTDAPTVVFGETAQEGFPRWWFFLLPTTREREPAVRMA